MGFKIQSLNNIFKKQPSKEWFCKYTLKTLPQRFSKNPLEYCLNTSIDPSEIPFKAFFNGFDHRFKRIPTEPPISL
jgi:hypothetical protein